MNNLTKEQDWISWKEICAYEGCPEEAKGRLGKFACLRFEKYCMEPKTHQLPIKELSQVLKETKLNHNSEICFSAMAKKVWHHFDTFVIQKNGRKSIKDWIAQKVGSLGEMESKASLLLRDVVKDFILDERGKVGTRTNDSLDRPVGDHGLNLGDLIKSDAVDPSKKAVLSELKNEIKASFDKLTRDLKITFLAKSQSISLDNTQVKELAGKGKSQLSQNWKKELDSIIEQLLQDDTLGRAGAITIQQMVLEEIYHYAKKWGENPENGCRQLLKLGDG
jgi:hypothetical protein